VVISKDVSNMSASLMRVQSYEKEFKYKRVCQLFCEKSVIPRKREEIKNTRHSSGLGFNAMNINIIDPDEWPDE